MISSSRPTMSLGAGDDEHRGHRTAMTGFPPDLLAQSARRLRILALIYAVVFFLNNPLPALLFPEDRVQFLSSFLRWGPSTISILTALVVAALTWQPRFSAEAVLVFGLLFEVAGSFGIAAAQYLDVARYATEPPWAGLSWVAIWMLGFTILVPSPPRWALPAAVVSASSVPLVVGYVVATEAIEVPFELSPLRFFFGLVLPYMLIVGIAYVGTRLLYRLGTELTRARELGSYRLVERLGAGGMGEVWRAEHTLLARPAAVKLMRPEMLGGSAPGRRAELQARFEREAQATSSLRSPHTIELYDFGVTDAGAFYYAMELLDGFDLQTLVERFGPVPAERAIHILIQVCHSLDEAHAAGLIHRDIKPANVYVCRYGRDLDFVKVLDFGLVKWQEEPNATLAGFTGGRTVRGTPAFMAPEQATGDRPVDGRSDLYAVGCLAYWLLTAEVVFGGRTVMDTILQHTQARPVPPSQRTELPVPPALERVILDCLEKHPDDRPASADVLRSRLLDIATPAWTPARANAWWSINAPGGGAPGVEAGTPEALRPAARTMTAQSIRK
jgi:serine/threonine-protein kinase